MNEFKLTDFSLFELNTLLTTVLVSEIHKRSNIALRKEVYEKAGALYPMDVAEVKAEHLELESLELWHVQIMNAIVCVASKDTVQNN